MCGVNMPGSKFVSLRYQVRDKIREIRGNAFRWLVNIPGFVISGVVILRHGRGVDVLFL